MAVACRRYEHGVAQRLEELRGARVFFDPLGGNNGDQLIVLGSRLALQRAGIELVDTVARADAVVVNGGGGITVEMWSPGLASFRRQCERAPDKPLVVLPSSFHVSSADLPGCLDGRRAPVWLFARERYSAAYLEALAFPVETYVGLDHDMAFALRDSDFLADVRRRSTAAHVLLVERFDSECTTGHWRVVRRVYPLKRLIPAWLRAPAKSTVAATFSSLSGFSGEARRRLVESAPDLARLPVVCGDISFRGSYAFQEFVDLIAGAAAVATTRLHVGILAALLGKPTALRADGGPYRKIRGVYELSLASLPNVELW